MNLKRKHYKKSFKKFEKKRKESGCLIFERGFEAVRGILFWQKS